MRRVEAILAAALVIPLAGCVVGAKPKTAASIPPAPQPAAAPAARDTADEALSIPQTRVQLPPAQQLDPQALAPPLPVEAPAEPSTPATRSRPRNGPAQNPPKPETAAPAPPPAEVRAPLQDVIPAADLKRWQESAQATRKAVHQWLDSSARKRLKPREQATVERIRAYLKDSDAAERRGDMREADVLAERAQFLVKELQNGK